MIELYLIGGMVLVTFTIRYILYAVSGQFEFPDYLARALRYVPPTVLTAITVPAVLRPSGSEIALSYTNPYLVGALFAVVIGWVSRSLLLTIVLGMVVFLVWQWLLGTGVL
ncbi:MAG: AzlD domain-containing protein [Chloroflexota bacterium]